MAATRTIITLAEARTRFRSELDLVEAGVAGRIKATAQQGQITANDWASLLPARSYLRQIIRWDAGEIWLEPGNHKTGILIDIITETASPPPSSPARRQRGATDRERAELLCAAARPHLPGSLSWSTDRARREAQKIKDDPLLYISNTRLKAAWKAAKEKLRGEPPER
jgi:hypothetical protein